VSDRPELGYEFTPQTRAATRALADGSLDAYDYAILGALYDRDVPRNLRVRFTLDQLREWTSWAHTDDALSKRLRRLRHAGWLAYDQPRLVVYRPAPNAKPKRIYRYALTLVPEPAFSEQTTSLSALGPSSQADSQAESEATPDAGGPSSEGSGPSSFDAGIVAAERSGEQSTNDAGPSSPEGPEKPSSMSEVGTYGACVRAREEPLEEDAELEAELDRCWDDSKPKPTPTQESLFVPPQPHGEPDA
jgi:hypothetical protein